ncbi:MAG TPA: hypothetical protein VMW81_08155 [Nitrospinota bacterium]|nr:hypothetical protein [Nitrospinota bacterium]
MKNEIKKIEPKQLDEALNNSGLAIQEGEEIKKSYLPFLTMLAEAQSQASKINFESPSELDENIARELRLKTVKIRTAAEKLKEERKRIYLLRGNLEQASYNIIAASCKLTEEVFLNVEKAREIAEKKRQEALRREREEKLSPYAEDLVIYPLGLMKEDEFEALYISLRTVHENKLAAEKRAEEERLAKEKAEAEERERQRLENIRLKKEAEEREKQIAIEREKARREQEKKEKELQIEREKDELERRMLEERARKEREKRENLEAIIRVKREAEEKAKREAEKKKRMEERANHLAPDKTKLLNFCQTINDLPRPEVKSIEAADIASKANILLFKTVSFIKENANKL